MSKEQGYQEDFGPRVVIMAPDEETGRRVKAWVDVAGGFSAVVLPFHGIRPADIAGARPEILVLAPRDLPSGVSACRQLRAYCDLPLVVCARIGTEQDIVHVLDAGADDCILIPTQPRALGARLRAVLRRSLGWSSHEPPRPLLVAGQFEIRANGQRVFRRGQPIDLSAIEFRLLEALMRRPGQLVTHAQLLAEVWGPQYVDSRHYLRLYVRYLRDKIEDDPRHPEFLVNEWGVGYRFEPGETGALTAAAPQAAA